MSASSANSSSLSSSSSTRSSVPGKSRVSRGGRYNNNNNNRSRGGFKRNRNIEGGRNNNNSSSKVEEDEEELEEGEQCIICANKIIYAAVTPCHHTTCHKCTFRQRSQYEKTQCLICRSENEWIIITEEIYKTYDDFNINSLSEVNEKYNIKFTQSYVKDDTEGLLKFNCSLCDEADCKTFKDLMDHVKEAHNKFYCLICSKYKKAFIQELPLYTYKQLQRHQSEGDETGFKGHPECKHCFGKRFYSEDELNIHIRDKHERCYICDQYNPKTADYYRNYDTLYQHFKRDHYVCSVPSCIEKRFVVFREDLDLTAHMLKEHGGLNANSKVIIGSNSTRSYQSQLSTFPRRFEQQHAEEEDDYQSLDIKKKRFEERARHYLNYNQQEFSKFEEFNRSFKYKKINAKELLTFYREVVFIHQSNEELSLLIKEFSEFFKGQKELYDSLIVVENELNFQQPEREQFPVLAGASGSVFNANSWVNSSGGKSRSQSPNTILSSNDAFPALSKLSRKPVVNTTNQPIRYTTVLKKKPVVAPKINTASNPNYVPKYLDNGNSSTVVSPPSSTPVSASSSISSTRNNSTDRLNDDKKFPTLEKKTKRVIPRVNPVQVLDPTEWGRSQPTSSSSIEANGQLDDNLDFGVGIVINDKRKQKLKKKQDRLLFNV
ncbi:hypothetical protein DFJ63DRAFT_239632 [Scheffersomyces coipomensis]|uniref:uncharacterized protein n=1 Tax=Scheffersomyces coipomensis TaxID=1788519 RepID=UPI00315C6E99